MYINKLQTTGRVGDLLYMTKYKQLRDIIDIIIADGSITVNPRTHEIILNLDEWLVPRWPEITVIVPESRLEGALMEFIAQHSDKIQSEDVYLGVWRQGKQYYIDLNAHAKTIPFATQLAKVYSRASGRKIISAYNPATEMTHLFGPEV